MAFVGLAEVCKLYLLIQSVYFFIIYDDKLLVGRRIDIELEALSDEDVLHPHCHFDGMFR